MDLTHLHLILNHIPAVGIFIGFLTVAWGIVRRYDEVQKAGLIMLVLTALVAIPVYLTGEPAEETVEGLPGVSEQIIELHEDAAIYSLVLAIVTGALAIVALFAMRFLSTKTGLFFAFVALLVSFISGASMAYTANLGGQIRHTEIRQAQGADTGPQGRSRETKKEENDDH